MNKKHRSILIYGAVFAALLIFFMMMVNNLPGKEPAHTYSDIVGYFQREEVEDFTLDLGTGELELTLNKKASEELREQQENNSSQDSNSSLLPSIPGNSQPSENQTNGGDTEEKKNVTFVYSVPNVGLFVETIEPLVIAYNAENPDNTITYDYYPIQNNSWWIDWLPTIVTLVCLAGLLVFMMRQQGGGKISQFGKTNLKNAVSRGKKATFADVAGADEEKEELSEIVDFLKNPKSFNELGARIPKGVLLMGPPGTGKTLLARAVAGEAGVPFFSISGSDFVEMFVGVGASRVRDLFEQAKKNAPAIIFIDEIDAVGRHRGAGLGGGHDEREQTLNQLLVEMDGFGENEGVIVIAATNRRDILDPALLRPGRFDRSVMVGYPDIKGREEILKVHSRNKPLGFDVDLKTVAKQTPGFTGADLENLMNEAALLAARRKRKAIVEKDIEDAAMKVMAGPEKRSKVVSEKDKRLTAFHEAGHAVATYYCEHLPAVHQVSIIPRGQAGGYTMSLPEQDRSYVSKTEMKENLIVLLGGRIAEKLTIHEVSTGASNDLERATKIARSMVMSYGFSKKVGMIVYGEAEHEVFLGRDLNQNRNYSEEVAATIDGEIRRFIDEAMEACERILTDHMDQLTLLAEYLMENEKIDGETFKRLMEGTLDYTPALETPKDSLPDGQEPVTIAPEVQQPQDVVPDAEPPAMEQTDLSVAEQGEKEE